MCGILAISGENLDIKKYDTVAMLDSLKKRGPDGVGEKLIQNCYLGHRRLSIIDIENGFQPMTSSNLTVTFNGEIYNYKELKKELEYIGYKFDTNSDTEVILKSYEEWGKGCVQKLDGMFAFAVWNSETQELFFARDRFGKKPLFYYLENGILILASEIKSILTSGNVHPEIDFRMVDHYLSRMYIKPDKSIYKNIFQVPPAHFAIFRKGSVNIERYWKLSYEPISVSYEDAKNEVHRLLINAISKRLLSSDVEVGTFLSGGVDSSLVTLIAAKIKKDCLKVFTVSYKDHDELPYALEVSNKIQSDLYKIDIDFPSISELENVLEYFDEPHADTSDFPQHLISKLASEKLKVVLSGDGADELFLGYKWHLNKEGVDIFDRRINDICAFDKQSRFNLWSSDKNLSDNELDSEIFNELKNNIEKVEMFDITSHLPGQILTKVDRASMMHGLEVRSPFLDTKLVEYVFNLPYEYKVNKDGQKRILRDILLEYMPKEFAYRKKQGFGSPIWLWLSQKDMKDFVLQKLGPGALIRNFLQGKEIDKYMLNLYNDENSHDRAGQRVWVLLCLELWAEKNRKYIYEK
jgi:asparagine synthase (glutamine-hydrolysing)